MLALKNMVVCRRAAAVVSRACLLGRTPPVCVRRFSAALPEGWEKITRRNGDVVFYNSALRKTVRELPGFPRQTKSAAQSSPAPDQTAAPEDASKQEEAQVLRHHEPTENEVFVPIDFAKAARIEGHESQVIHIDLEPQQCLRAESGAMIYMTDQVEMETTTAGGFQQGAKRLLTGENFFVTRFTYHGDTKGTVALGTSFPSKIIHLRLEDFIGNSVICQKGAFLCGSDTINIEMEFAKKLGVGFFGGEGFILQRLTGEGDAFVRASGALIQRELREGEVLRLSSGCLVAFEPTVAYDITMMKGVKNIMFGGEGLFVTTLTGPGKIYIQSLPFDRVVSEIASRVPGGGHHGVMFPFFGGGGGGGGEAAGDSPDADSAVPPEEDGGSTWDSSADSEANIYGDAGNSEFQSSSADSDDFGGDDASEEAESGVETVVDFFRDFFGRG